MDERERTEAQEEFYLNCFQERDWRGCQVILLERIAAALERENEITARLLAFREAEDARGAENARAQARNREIANEQMLANMEILLKARQQKTD